MMHINILLIATLLDALLLSGCYAADSIPGYEYVGEGSCFGANGGYHPSPLSYVSATDTFDPNDGAVNCATYCNNFRSIGESFRGFDGGYYGCQCRFDVGVTEELLSPIYMSLDNEVNWVDQFSYLETGEITSTDGYSYDWEFNINKGFNYCYKVVPFESPLIADEDTECVDTQDYEDQWGGKCVEYESNAAWCGGYGEMGESGLTPNENCCVCKSKSAPSTSATAVVTPSPTIPAIPEEPWGIYYESFEDGVLPDLWSTSFSYAPLFRRGLQEDFRFTWTVSSESPQTGVYSVKTPEVSFGSGGFLGEYKLTLTTPQDWGAGSLYFSILSYIEFSSVGFTEDLNWYIDDKYEGRVTKGSTEWELHNMYLESGQHEVTWMYTADVPSGYSGGKTTSSASYLDDLNFIPDLSSVLDDNTQTDSETEVVETIDETSYPGDVEGFDYVGIGNCRDNGEQSYPSVSQIYTFSTEECANFCIKVGVDQSLGVLRGYAWGGDISGGLQIHCNCFFDSGADTEAIASQYGGEREHWGIMEPARFSTEGQGTGMISGTVESDYEVYCYKVIDQTVDSETATNEEEPWEVEETSPLSTDTPSKQMTFPPYSFDSTFFSSSNTPTVAVCPEEEAAFQSCITVDEDNIGSFVDCSLCGLEAMGDDIFDFSGYCERWDSCVSEMCPADCVEPINAYQRCILDDSGILDLVDCFNSDSVTDPITGSTDTEALPTDNMSPIPTTANDGIDDQFCLEETKALEDCGIYDIDNLDMAEACAMCQVEAMGDDVMNFNTDSFCNKWKACANEKCPAACITPMNDLQVCMFQDTGMTVDCLSSPDNANADNVVNEVESKAQRRQVITAVMIMVICGVLFV